MIRESAFQLKKENPGLSADRPSNNWALQCNILFSYVLPFNLPYFAEIPIITHPESGKATYRESEAVSISCKSSGKPVPYVSWIHNGRVTNSGSKTATLNFSSISKADAGSYTCKANNSAGIAQRQLILLVSCKYHMTYSFVQPVLFDYNKFIISILP